MDSLMSGGVDQILLLSYLKVRRLLVSQRIRCVVFGPAICLFGRNVM